MKTTPKPRATKKSKGELVGPPPPPEPADVVAAGGPMEVGDGLVLGAAEDAILETVWCAGMAQLDEIQFVRLANHPSINEGEGWKGEGVNGELRCVR